jgi:hypothetical protein
LRVDGTTLSVIRAPARSREPDHADGEDAIDGILRREPDRAPRPDRSADPARRAHGWFRATDVPTGTDLEVTVKPKVGAPPFSQRVTLTPASCTGGTCNTAVSFDLAAGAYIVEARATFETP